MVFNGMRGPSSSPGALTKDDMRKWTKEIMQKKFPDKKFDEKTFESGFRRLDSNKDGLIHLDDIRGIVLKKVQKENLYEGK